MEIKLHPSYFLVLDNANENSKIDLALSEEASEWLFHAKFWEKINDQYQTDFAQFEEDNLPINIMNEVLSLLLSKISDLKADNRKIISFCYGWNQNKEELFCRAETSMIADDLFELVKLLRTAKNMECDVYCQL